MCNFFFQIAIFLLQALDGDVLYAEFYDRILNQPEESVYQTVSEGMNLLKSESSVIQISEGSLKVNFTCMDIQILL